MDLLSFSYNGCHYMVNGMKKSKMHTFSNMDNEKNEIPPDLLFAVHHAFLHPFLQ